MPQRRELMVQLIQREGQVSISQLKEAFPKVSEMTLRRDLEILNRSGQIVRIHGGAKSIGAIVGLSEELHARRSQENVANKQIISKKALSLLKPNISIFIDSGTTTTAFAHVLPDMDMLITTSGITVAMELIHMTNVSVYLTGGKLNRNSISITGAQTVNELHNLNFDIAFLGVTGYSIQNGFTVNVQEEAELKKTVMKRTKKTVLLMDESKIGQIYPYTFGTTEDIDCIVSDNKFPPEVLREFEKYNINVL